MKYLFYLSLSLFTTSLFAQPLFLGKQLDSPSSETVSSIIEFIDIDGDGDEDLVGIGAGKNIFLVYLNQGGTIDTFPQTIEVDLDIIFNITEWESVDWNNDNLPDLLVEGTKLFLNQGNLIFDEGTQLNDVGSWLYLNDVNNDGYQDLVSGSGDVYENNNGNPSVTVQPGFVSGFSTSRGNYFDMNGDGLKDYLWTFRSGDTYDLVVYEATAPYQFEAIDTVENFSTVPITQQLGACEAEIIIEDLDGDGTPEAIIKACWRVYVLKLNGAFSFDLFFAGDTFISNSYDFGISDIGDIDGNGFKEIIANNSILFNDNFSFSKTNFSENLNYTFIDYNIVDTDGDNIVEIWKSNITRMERFSYTSGTSISGAEEIWKMYPVRNHGAIMDVNNDGLWDYVYPSFTNLVLSLNTGSAFSESVLIDNINTEIALYEIYPVDYNNDGWMDMLVRDEYVDVIRWLRNNQDNTFEDMGAIYGMPTDNSMTFLGIEDLNNDGLLDLITVRKANFNMRINYLMSNGSELINQQEIISTQSGTFGEYDLNFHDFNADGFLDLAVAFTRDNGARTLNIYENNNGTSFNHIFGQNLTIFGRWMGLSDMTQDGILDLCYGKSYDNSPNELIVIPSNGDGTFGNAQTQLFDEPFGDYQIMFDVNNDGLTDLFSESFASINTGTGLSSGFPHNPFLDNNFNYSRYVDYDQDGDLDLSSHGVYIWENLSIGDSKIVGIVFNDTNGNGIQDIGEVKVPDIKIGIDGFSSYFYTDDSGEFEFPLGSNIGTFQVSSQSDYNDLFIFTSSPYPVQATLTDTAPIDTVEIGLQVVSDSLSFYQYISNQRCNDVGRVWLDYLSLRSGMSEGLIELTLPNNISYAGSASISPSTINENTLTWELSDIDVFENANIWLDINNPDFQSAGDTLAFISKMQTWIGTDTITVFDTSSVRLICAYDPNDKTITNIGDFAEGDAYYTTQDETDYLIRFQNTGTAPAIDVLIRDNLSSDFDYESFRFLSASHPVEIALNEQGLLEANFANINLPDSTADFTGSMGYIAFRIDLKENVVREKNIQNGARIYFDQNPPIYTNLTQFQRVDCNHFLQVQTPLDQICGNTEIDASVYNFGVPQNYEWILGEDIISMVDSAHFLIPDTGIFPLQLSTTNKICSADTVVQFMIDQIAPQTLGLSFMDTTLCADWGGVELEADVLCNWYWNGEPYPDAAMSVFLSFPGTYTAENFFGDCKLVEEVTLSIQDFSYEVEDYFLDIPDNGFVFCSGEEMEFSTALSTPFYWTYSETGNQEYQGNPVQIPSDPNANISSAQISLVKDTLNCTIGATVDVSFIEDLNFENTSPQEYLLCEGFTDSILVELQTNPIGIDSLHIYQDGILITTFGSNAPLELYLDEVGDYEFIAYLACQEASIITELIDFADLVPILSTAEDSLYTSTGAEVNWFYTADANMMFNELSSGSAVLNPVIGYYYFSYEVNDCVHLSDTLFFNVVSTSNFSNELQLNYQMESKTLQAMGDIPLGTTLELLDVSGKKLISSNLQSTHTFRDLSSGIYIILIVHPEKGRITLKIPIIN